MYACVYMHNNVIPSILTLRDGEGGGGGETQTMAESLTLESYTCLNGYSTASNCLPQLMIKTRYVWISFYYK